MASYVFEFAGVIKKLCLVRRAMSLLRTIRKIMAEPARVTILSKDVLFFGSLEKTSGSVQPKVGRGETAIIEEVAKNRF